MIDINALGNADERTQDAIMHGCASFFQTYTEFKEPLEKVVVAPYSVKQAYLTQKASKYKQGNSTQFLHLCLLLLEATSETPADQYIKVKLKGPTTDESGKLVSPSSAEFSAFINYALRMNNKSIEVTNTWTTNFGEVREYLGNMEDISGLVAFGTTYFSRGFNSYGAIFFMPSTNPSMPPYSIYEALYNKGQYRDNKGDGQTDFVYLTRKLQDEIDELFEVKHDKEQDAAIAATTPQERAAAIPQITQPKSTVEDDSIPF